MVTNFNSRYINGNRKSQGIKIGHWNKGGSHLKNKMPEIKQIVSGLHPHILGISEANLLPHHDQSLVQIPDCKIDLPKTLVHKDNKYCRIVTYTHKSLVAKLKPDLMTPSAPFGLRLGYQDRRSF